MSIKSEAKLTTFEAISMIVGNSIGTGIIAVPYLATKNSMIDVIWMVGAAYVINVILHLIIAELSYNNGGVQLVKSFEGELFHGVMKKVFSWIVFVVYGRAIMIGVRMVVFATSANQAVIQVVKGLDGNPGKIRKSILIGFGLSSAFVLVVTLTVLLGTKGTIDKELAYMQLGESIGKWAVILAGIFSLFALLTTFWSNTLALRDVVHEQVGIGNRVSWLIATVPCILFAIFGVSSFIILTRIMSGVVVLVSIMLVLTYGKSRKKAGASPICGVIGTLPFQILMVVSTIVSAIGALIPLS